MITAVAAVSGSRNTTIPSHLRRFQSAQTRSRPPPEACSRRRPARAACRSWPVSGAPLAVEPAVLDLVEQGPVGDVEELRGAHPVPLGLLERLQDGFLLGDLGRLAGDVLQ